MKNKETIKSSIKFEFYLDFLRENRHEAKIYNVFLKLFDEYELFGLCYVRKKPFEKNIEPVTVLPITNYYYHKQNNCDELVMKKIAQQIALEVSKKMF